MIIDSTNIVSKKNSNLVVTKVPKEAPYDYKPALELLKIVIWPIAAIFCFLLVKKSIVDLINRISKIGYGKIGAETSQQQNENHDNAFLEKSKFVEKNETIEKALGLFSPDTIAKAAEFVDKESKVKEIKDVNDQVEVLRKYSQALYLILSFDRSYNLLFGSQLFILERVNTTTAETKASLRRYYDEAQKSYPEFYESYLYDDYFTYLINSNFIILQNDDTIQITSLGKDFLKYLVETGKSLNKRY